MIVRDVKALAQVSEHMYELREQITARDLLQVVRFLSSIGKRTYSGYWRGQGRLLYSSAEELTEAEFGRLLSQMGPGYSSIDYILNSRYRREELLTKIASATKVKRTATKHELLSLAAADPDLLFVVFKQDIVEAAAGQLAEYLKSREQLASDCGEYHLTFATTQLYHQPLSGGGQYHFWVLGKDRTVEPADYTTTGYGSNLFLNLADSDQELSQAMEELSAHDPGPFELNPYSESLRVAELVPDRQPIRYQNDIEWLSAYFGRRRASKFETFASGLAERSDPQLVNELGGSKFVVWFGNQPVYMGRACDQELFEKIAAHLKIEYLGNCLICTVTESQTTDALLAIWQQISSGPRAFDLVRLQ